MKKGYLIPENAQPTTNRCLRVFVPDDPLYVAAFLGALTYFGQWTAWERDIEKRGQFAARAWKEANEITIDGLSLPCGDNPITDEEMSEILEQLAQIRSQLAEINDMNITVTQTNGCGCCDGEETTTQTIEGIIIDPEDTGIIPPYMTENVIVVDSARCRAANWMATIVAQMTRTMSTIGTMPITLSNVVSVLIAIFTVGNGLIWSMTAILALGYRLINGLTSDSYDYFDTVADAMENSMQSFVCALYNWTSADNLGAMLNGEILGFVNDAKLQLGLSDTVANSMYTALADVMGAAFVNYFVQNIDTIVPAAFVPAYSCLCGATGDSCPTSNLVLAGVGTLPAGDLTGTTQGFGSSFNSQTGYYEVIFELADNYCVAIDNGQYVGELTPTAAHETCAGGVMVASDGSCIRRFVARSQTPFGTAVTFDKVSNDCSCEPIWEAVEYSTCSASMTLDEDENSIEYSGTISKNGDYGAYSFIARIPDSENCGWLSDKVTTFSSTQNQGLSVDIRIGRDLGGTTEWLDINVSNGSTVIADLTGRTATYIQISMTVGNYSLPCPQALSGILSWTQA